MEQSEPQFLELAGESGKRRIAYRIQGDRELGLFWLSGFLSDMSGGKATAMAEFAARQGLGFTAFDYSGHGLSGGRLIDGAIGDWLAEAEAVAAQAKTGKLIVIGSSMGGWLALLLARALAGTGRVAGLVLIAPAWDMTEVLMWRKFTTEVLRAYERDGIWWQPSDYGDPYPITKRLIEEGRKHLIEGKTFDPGCPVRILQGMRDADVPWQHALALLNLLRSEDLELTLIKDGDHRLSTPEDIERLERTVAALTKRFA
jgi:pimeloyl-ACP methyl ester carboxylesterase